VKVYNIFHLGREICNRLSKLRDELRTDHLNIDELSSKFVRNITTRFIYLEIS
jgi:hypothetical protein